MRYVNLSGLTLFGRLGLMTPSRTPHVFLIGRSSGGVYVKNIWQLVLGQVTLRSPRDTTWVFFNLEWLVAFVDIFVDTGFCCLSLLY